MFRVGVLLGACFSLVMSSLRNIFRHISHNIPHRTLAVPWGANFGADLLPRWRKTILNGENRSVGTSSEENLYRRYDLAKIGYANCAMISRTLATFSSRSSFDVASQRKRRYGSVFDGRILNHQSGNSTRYPSKSI